jgi:Tol biopolymer transport system component
VSIFVASPPFEHATKLTADNVSEATPEWSNDGAWIAYAARAELPAGLPPGWEVRIVRPDGSDQRTLVSAHPGIAFSSLAWSPDGKQLGFTRYDVAAHTRRIGVVDLDGTHEAAISTPDANDRILAWVR